MLSKYLVPDEFFNNIYEITPEYLSELGVRGMILDIDNTLVTYDDAQPTPELLKWFDAMTNAGISIAFVSNNDNERVRIFNSELGYFASGKSKKPFGKKIREAMAYMGTTKENTLLIGDQLLTDIMAGKCAGLKSFLVLPIKDKKTLFFRVKRTLEKPYIRKYKRIHGDKNE